MFYKQADGNYYQDSPFMDPYKETGKGYVKILTTLITESQIFPGRSVNQIQWFIVPIQSHGLEEYTQMIEGRDFSKMEVKLKKAEDIENWASWFTRLPVEIIKKVRHIFFTNDMGFTIELNERYFETLRRDLDSKLGEKLRNPIHLNFNSSNGPNPFTMPCIYECFGSSPFIKQFHEWAANETIDVYVY